MAEIKGGVVIERGENAEGLKNLGFGVVHGVGVALSFEEALYLLEKGKIEITGAGGKELKRMGIKKDSRFPDGRLLFKFLRDNGYVVRPAEETGVYRVYEKGVLPGEDNAKTIVRLIDDAWKATAKELKNEVGLAHRLRKRFVFAVMEKGGKPTFFELRKREFW